MMIGSNKNTPRTNGLVAELREYAEHPSTGSNVAQAMREAADTLEAVSQAVIFGSRMDANPTIGAAWQNFDWLYDYHRRADESWYSNMVRALEEARYE